MTLFVVNINVFGDIVLYSDVITVLLIKNCTHFINSCISRRSKTAKIIL